MYIYNWRPRLHNCNDRGQCNIEAIFLFLFLLQSTFETMFEFTRHTKMLKKLIDTILYYFNFIY